MSSGSWGVFQWGRNSPVATRPEDTQFFPVGLSTLTSAGRSSKTGLPVGSTQAADYRDQADGSVLEPQVLAVLGRPSMHIYREPGTDETVINIRRNVSNIAAMPDGDLGFIDEWCRVVLEQLKAFSNGPYTERDLRRMGHPYGFDQSWLKGHDQFVGRRVPGRDVHKRSGVKLSINHVRGVRGTVPTMAVVNRQSGNLQKSWSSSWARDSGGFDIQLRNSMPYSWFLVHGTQRMQPHGPFVHVPLSNLRRLDNNLHRAISKLRFRALADRSIDRLMESVMVHAR